MVKLAPDKEYTVGREHTNFFQIPNACDWVSRYSHVCIIYNPRQNRTPTFRCFSDTYIQNQAQPLGAHLPLIQDEFLRLGTPYKGSQMVGCYIILRDQRIAPDLVSTYIPATKTVIAAKQKIHQKVRTQPKRLQSSPKKVKGKKNEKVKKSRAMVRTYSKSLLPAQQSQTMLDSEPMTQLFDTNNELDVPMDDSSSELRPIFHP